MSKVVREKECWLNITVVPYESLSPLRIALGAHEGADHEIANSQEENHQQKYLGLRLPFQADYNDYQ